MSMQGKVVVITGSNVGIGFETAVGIAKEGATTVLACRNPEKAAAAAAQVTARSCNSDVSVVLVDLADLASVRKAADEVLARFDRLDVLVNNAGGTWSPRQETAQGFEYTFGVNHLGPFYLTRLLEERLVASAPARVVNVTSVGHHFAFGGMRWDDLQSTKRYATFDAYCQSKLANILVTREAARRLAGTVTVNAVHPGAVRSGFGMDGDLAGVLGLGAKLVRPFEITPAMGARTSVFLATSPSVEGRTGLYWARRKPGHMSAHARNEEAPARLWQISEELLAGAGFALG